MSVCVCGYLICLHRRNHLTATSRRVKFTSTIQYGEKYLANSFCDTLASINLIHVSFVIIYNQETG